MANPPCSMIPVALAVFLGVMAGCGDGSGESKKPAHAAPATRAALPVSPAPTPAQLTGGGSATTTQMIAPGHPVIERAEPVSEPPPLRLTLDLASDNPYVGEPLPVRLYLSSPRADALIDGGRREASPTQPAERVLSTVSSDWPASVHFVLFQAKDGQLRPAGAELDWSKLRVSDRAAFGGNAVADWEIPASASLPAGEYLLRVTWDGGKSIKRSLEGSELSSEVRFAIATPRSDQEKAEHAERMALLAYRQGRFAETRRLAEEAVKADRQSMTPQRVQMLLAQADACLAMDDFKSGLEVYRSILKMPLDDRLATDLGGKVKLLEKLAAKPK